jgi:glycosyltransferase involved in cell wall biosynthesis
MTNSKILMLVRTSGLEYDDRVRKECLSLKKLGYTIQIIANYTSNEKLKGITSYGVEFRTIRLLSRSLFPSAKFLVLKMVELWFIIFFFTIGKKFEFIWVHEEYMALNLLFKPHKGKYIWDQHELPQMLIQSKMRKKIYLIIEKKCYAVIVANKERLQYLIDKKIVKKTLKYFILNNFPDDLFAGIKVQELPSSVNDWLGDKPYVLMQGGGHDSRYPLEVLQVLKENGMYKAILVGPVSSKMKNIMDTAFKEVVFLTGYIPQLSLPIYMDHAFVSIILYNASSPNSYYCEPNRLYQAISRGIPLIVGNNPPMANIVTNNQIGVVLKDDGQNKEGLACALHELSMNYNLFKKNLEPVKDKFLWNSQIETIKSIVQKRN